jgi:Domain of unknown function (DUF4384)
MLLPLLAVSLILSPEATRSPGPVSDPVISIRLSDDFYFQGERAKVWIKASRDGYILILRMDGEGRIRPLFPVDPADSAFIRGGREFEVRSRGDRETFTVDEREGVGRVFAAFADVPFDLSRFSRGGHWDYRALSVADSLEDPEAALLDLTDSMTSADYDYDVVSYTVGGDRRHRAYSGWHGYPRYFDPWYHSSYPFYGPRYGVSFGIFLGGRHRYRRRWF